jgi:ribosomal protein S19E (S16A)
MHRLWVASIIRKLRTAGGLTARSLRRRFGQRLLAATADERGTAGLLGLKRPENARPYRRQQ